MLNKKHAALIDRTAAEIAALLPYIVQGVPSSTLAKASLTQTQFRMIVTMSLKGACTMGAMARQMKVSMPTVTGLVDRLVAARYLKRVKHPDDRRQILIELTPQAHVFLKEFEAVYARRWVEILQILDADETAQMLVISTKLNQGLKAQKT